MKCKQLNQPFQTDIVPPVILHLLTREYHGGLTLGLTPGLPIQIYKENQPRSFSQKIRTLRELKRRGGGGEGNVNKKTHENKNKSSDTQTGLWLYSSLCIFPYKKLWFETPDKTFPQYSSNHINKVLFHC